MSEGNLTGPRFKVGDRVVRVNDVREASGVVVETTTDERVVVKWSPRYTWTHAPHLLEPAERWQTDAERDER